MHARTVFFRASLMPFACVSHAVFNIRPIGPATFFRSLDAATVHVAHIEPGPPCNIQREYPATRFGTSVNVQPICVFSIWGIGISRSTVTLPSLG